MIIRKYTYANGSCSYAQAGVAAFTLDDVPASEEFDITDEDWARILANPSGVNLEKTADGYTLTE